MTILSIILISAVFIWLEYFVWDKYDSLGENLARSILGVPTVIVILTYLLYFIISMVGSIGGGQYQIYHKEQSLYGLNCGSGVSGSFILGCGTVGDKQYIFYNVQDPETELIRTEKRPLENVSIKIEPDSINSYIEKARYCPKLNGFGSLFLKNGHSVLKYSETVIVHIHEGEIYMGNNYDIRTL